MEVEPDLRPESLDKSWARLMQSVADREHLLSGDVNKMDHVQRLAEKVSREIKHTDIRITELEVRVTEESRRIDRQHPVDAKNIVESIETEVRHLETPLHDMDQDCRVLKENRYPQASDLSKKVKHLHQRWSTLRTTFHTTLVQKLSGLSYPVHETTITKQTRTVVETRQLGANPYFRDLEEYTEWCHKKLKELLASDYGSDLPSVKIELDRHQREHKVIDQFHPKVIHAERQAVNFSGDELHLYEQRLNQLKKIYAELLATSSKRLTDLDALQDFLNAATAELQWLNDREQIEISRDWADKNLDLPGTHRYYEVSAGITNLYACCMLTFSLFYKRTFGKGGEVIFSCPFPSIDSNFFS